MNKDYREVFEKQQERSLKLRHEKLKERKKRIQKIINWTLKNEDRIKEAHYKDMKKPPVEVEISEMFPVVSEGRYAISNLSSWAYPDPIDMPLHLFGTRGRIFKEPKGVCLIISPWNFPYNLAFNPLVSCLAAGNTAILKPSEMTPHVASLIEEMVEELFEPDLVYVVNGGIDVSRELLKLPFNHIFFTGSPAIGKIIMKAASKNLTSVTLELGGKNPVFIAPDASLKEAARKIVWSKVLNCGQSCVSSDFILVEEGKKEEFIGFLEQNIEKMTKNGKDENTFGRIVNQFHFDRLKNLIDTSLDEGAKIRSGGESNREDCFLQPTIIDGISFQSELMKEEIFGPIIPIITYKDFEEILRKVRELPVPLASYIFTRSSRYSNKIKKGLPSGAFVVNDCVIQFGGATIPFGGLNFSGLGKAHGKFGFDEFVNMKPVLKQIPGSGISLLYHPPYSWLKRMIVKFAVRYL